MDHQQLRMRAAWDALMAGDTSKRDTLLEDMAQARLMDAKERALQNLKAIDFFVRHDGVAIRSSDIRRITM